MPVVHQPGEGVCVRGTPGRQQAANLIQKALLELCIDPPRDALGRLLRRYRQSVRHHHSGSAGVAAAKWSLSARPVNR